MTQDISIKQWTENDWKAFKSIRLEALRQHNNFFGASLNVEASKDASFWKKRLVYDGAVFGLYDGDQVIGLTGIYYHWNGREDVAILCMSYIREEYRGQGLSNLLYQARLDWAKNQGNIKVLFVGHGEDNDTSRCANQRWNFELSHVNGQVYGNSEITKEFVCESENRK